MSVCAYTTTGEHGWISEWDHPMGWHPVCVDCGQGSVKRDPWDQCLDVDPFTGQPDHEHGDACPGGCE